MSDRSLPVEKFVRWCGFDVSPRSVVVIQARIVASGPAEVEFDESWALQTGDRPTAYRVMHQRVVDHLREQRVTHAAVLGSGVSGSAATLSLLNGAELRGVVQAAAALATGCVVVRGKASLNKASSRGKVAAYTSDDTYWSGALRGELRRGSREIMYLLLTEGRDVTE